MQFINNQVFHWNARIDKIAPVKVIFYDACLIKAILLLGTPDTLSGYGLGINIQKVFCGIENQPVFRLKWPVYPVSVFEVFNIELKYNHRKYIPNPVIIREFQNGIRNVFFPVKKQKLAGVGMVRMHSKIYAARDSCCAIDIVKSGTHFIAANRVKGNQVDFV